MTESRLTRWSPTSGFAFMVLFLVGSVITIAVPGSDDADSKIVSYYADDGNQLELELGYGVWTLAAVFFLWFLGVLWGRLRQAESEPRWLSGIALVSGGAFTVFMLVGLAVGTMVATSADATSEFQVDPNTARLLNDAVYPLTFETALPLAAPLVLAASLIFLRSGLLPRWLGRAGLVVALGCLVGFLGVPMLLFLAWVVVVASCLMRRPRAGAVTYVSPGSSWGRHPGERRSRNARNPS